MAKADSSYKCDAYLCRGYQYEDNTDNVQAYKAGDVVDFHVNLVAGHRPGYAVSHRSICTQTPMLTSSSFVEYLGRRFGRQQDHRRATY